MEYNNEIVQKDLRELIKENIDFSRFNGKSILITGANGMLASYLIYFFMYLNDVNNANIKIYALSRNVEKMKSKFVGNTIRDDVIIISQDVCEKIEIEDNIDYIIHMASSANPQSIVNNPIGIIEANIIGTFNVLKLAKEKKSEVIFTSTREIYGKMPDNVTLIKEDDMGALNCFDSRACYPESKRMAETILINYNLQYGVKFKNLRIAHSYGPGMNIDNDGRIMSDLISDVVYKRDIVLKSTGEAKRAFCYISDAISAILYVMVNGECSQAYNIANETEEISIKNLAELMAKKYSLKVEYKLETNNSKAYTNFKRVGLDTTKLESLGWKPKVGLEDGIQRTVISFKARE